MTGRPVYVCPVAALLLAGASSAGARAPATAAEDLLAREEVTLVGEDDASTGVRAFIPPSR